MSADTSSMKPKVPISPQVERAAALWREGKLAQATTELEAVLDSPGQPGAGQLDFQSRLQVALQLAELYIATDRLGLARHLLDREAAAAQELFEVIQQTGSPDQKRVVQSGYVQIRDRAAQLWLIGAPAPEIAIREWVLGQPVTLAELRGRVVLLEFWATWCRPCIEMFAALRTLHAQYAERGLVVVALTRFYASAPDDAEAQARELHMIRGFLDGRGIEFPVGVAADESTQRGFGGVGVPGLVLLDRQGVIREARLGGTGPNFDDLLTRCLEESAGA